MPTPHMKTVGLLFALAMVVADIWLSMAGVSVTRRIPPGEIRHETGHAYVTTVRLAWPLVASSDSAPRPRASRLVVLENGVPLATAHAVHDSIRLRGGGQFSHWGDQIYFSTPDNADPGRNGRRYEVRFSAFLDWRVGATLLFIGIGLLVASRGSAQSARDVTEDGGRSRRSRRRSLGVEMIPRVIVGMAALALPFLATEALFRSLRPFALPAWPSVFDGRVGFLFEPGSIVRWTNNVDFWAETRANSLGFLDREPPSSRPPNSCRVLFIGDSFVEAAQVPIDRKFHVIFERLASDRIRRPFQTVALGFSGTGQANQLPFYEVFGKRLKPDVVVLVFANNDFGNNSSALEALRSGWDPLHAPRLFFRRDERTGTFARIPIATDWQVRMLPANVTSAPGEIASRLHDRLFAASFLYRWAFTHISTEYPGLAKRITPQTDVAATLGIRMRAIKHIPGFDRVFEGWRYPDDLDYDTMFFATVVPPVFRDAIETTGHAVDEFLDHARRDRFTVLALATHSLHLQRDLWPMRTMFGRVVEDDGYYQRLAALLSSRDVPLIDQHDYIKRLGANPANAHFHRDGHWSEQGHRWAAEALLEFFASHPAVCPSDGR